MRLRCANGPKAGIAVQVPHGEETWDFPLGDRQTARYRVIGATLVLQEIVGLPPAETESAVVTWRETEDQAQALLPDGSTLTAFTLPGLFCHVVQQLRRMGYESVRLVRADLPAQRGPEQREGPRRSEALPSYD